MTHTPGQEETHMPRPRVRKPEPNVTSLRIKKTTHARIMAEIERLNDWIARGRITLPVHELHGLTIDTWLNWILDQSATHRERGRKSDRKRKAGRKVACDSPGDS